MRKSLIVMAWFAGWLLMVSAAQADLSDGLVGYWTFDEGTGTVARDQSVSANHGTLTNGPLWVDGKFGKAIKFTEATGGQYVKTSKPIGLNQWIMSLWIKLATPFPNGESPYYGLYAMLSVDPVYGFSVNAKGVTLYPDQVTAFDFQSQADQWHHVVFGYDGKSAFAIVDGLVFGAVQTANPLAKNVLRCIGSKGWNTNNFNGIIDEVRLYNRVLTEREIAILYNPALANDITPPVITQTYPIAGSDVPSWSRYDRIRVTTDEAAACRFSDKPGVAYEDMTGIFTILSDNALAMDVKELESGKSVTYYVRCRDKAANYNLTDTPVALKVAEDHTPPEFWRINVPLITEDTADILWSTTEITDGQLEWGLTASYGNQSPVEASKAIPHAVLLQHLQPGTTYHFRVKSADVIGNMAISTDQTFTTKPLSTSVNFYVATNGSDITGDGSLSKPFATLEKARNLVRAYKTANGLPPGGITVWLRGGKYYRSMTFVLAAADSGVAGSPIIYRSYPGETAVITGGKSVTAWSPAVNSPLAAYLNPAVISKIYVADLKAQGIPYVATMDGDGSKYGMQFIFNGQPMTLARYPNAGYENIGNVVNVGNVTGTAGAFNYTDIEPALWHDTTKLWLSGYYYYGWSYSHNKVASLDTTQKLITMTANGDATTPGHSFGYRSGQWYQYENIIEELDAPGEWYLDAVAGLLYFYPPSDIFSGDAKLATVDNLIVGSNISYVTFRDLIMENARVYAAYIDGTDVSVINSVIRNTGNRGLNINVRNNIILLRNKIYNTGHAGADGSGADPGTLVPVYSEFIGNQIFNTGLWSKCSTALEFGGIEAHIANNEIFNAPYNGIFVHSPNYNNIVEYNHIYDVMKLSQDGGAIYDGGVRWTQRGTIIRYNYIHDIYGKDNLGAESIYLDDTNAGQTVWGNILPNSAAIAAVTPGNAGSGINFGGGRDNIIENNIVVNMRTGISLGVWYSNTAEAQSRINAINYKVPPFTTMYPELNNLNDASELFNPRGSTIRHNIFYQNYGSWLYQLYGADFTPIVDMRDNLIDVDPGFVNSPIGNFGLRPDSPAYALGFKPIPYEKIGLLKDSAIGVPGVTNGDVSGDGRVTMYDAALVLKYTVGGPLTGAQQAQADINNDTTIDATDAMAIAKKALGL